MRKLSKLSLTLIITLFCSCDPGFYQEYYIVNDSSHAVTIETLIDVADTYWLPTWSSDSVTNFENPDGIVIPAYSQQLVHAEGGLGVACMESSAPTLQHYIFGDSVVFRFDDGHYLKYTYYDISDNSPYTDSSYTFTMTSQSYGSSSGVSTYTITEADYLRSLE